MRRNPEPPLETAPDRRPILLQLDSSALLLELGLDLVCLLLGDSLLDRLGRAIHEILGLLQTEAGDLTHDLDDLNLLLTGSGEDHVELRLLLSGRCAGGSTRGRTGSDGHRGRGGHTEL